MKDYSGVRRAPRKQNYVPEFLDGYDYQYQMVQDYRNNLQRASILQARVMEIIDINSGKTEEIAFAIVAKTILDEHIEDPTDLTKFRECKSLCLLDHFIPESPQIAANQRPEIGQLVNVYYKDPENKTGGIYAGFAEKFTLNDLKEDTYESKQGVPSAKNAHSNNTTAKQTLGAATGTSKEKKTPDEIQKLLERQISPNFKLKELVRSNRVSQEENIPNEQEIAKLKLLAENILEPLTSHYGKKPTITNAFRGEKFNNLVGGAKNSQHRLGEAVDLEMSGVSTYDLAIYIKENLSFDQLILEYHNPSEGANSGWIHVSYSQTRLRKQLLTINKKTGNEYKNGFIV